MNTIIIEADVGYIGKKELYTVEWGDRSAAVTYAVKEFGKRRKPVTKKIPVTDYQKIADAFLDLDFSEIYKESGDLVGFDGWTLKCTIQYVNTELSILLWCPSKDKSTPETTKLLEAYDLVTGLFEEKHLE